MHVYRVHPHATEAHTKALHHAEIRQEKQHTLKTACDRLIHLGELRCGGCAYRGFSLKLVVIKVESGQLAPSA